MREDWTYQIEYGQTNFVIGLPSIAMHQPSVDASMDLPCVASN